MCFGTFEGHQRLPPASCDRCIEQKKALEKQTPSKETRAKKILAMTSPAKEAGPTRITIKRTRRGAKSGAYEIKKIRCLASKKARKEAEEQGLEIETAKAKARMAYNAPI